MKLLAKDPQVRPGSGTLLLAEVERIWAGLETRGKLGKRPALPADDPLPPPAAEGPGQRPRGSSSAENRARPLMRRPVVVIPLFLLCSDSCRRFLLARTDPDELWRGPSR